MAAVAGPLAIGATVLSTLQSYSAQKTAANAAAAEGAARQQAAEYEANQLAVKAGQERAVAQREMMEERRKQEIVQSNLQAAAAASGGSATDPGVLDLAGDIAEEGEYRVGVKRYEGEERARSLEGSASLRRFEGEQEYQAGQIKKKAGKKAATATLLSGFAQAGSLYKKYYP